MSELEPLPESNRRPQADALPTPQRLFDLSGRVAVVVGGAGRIGRALCEALAAAGAAVAIVDLSPSAAELAAQLGQASGRPTLALSTDITRRDQLESAAAEIAGTLGPATVLINSAQYRGAGFYSSQAEDYPLEAWNQVLDVNLTAVLAACQAFGKYMIAGQGGSIINLASTYGLVSPDPRIYGDSGVNSPVAYAASKAGVVQLTRYLAIHWRQHSIRVNCLVPGGVFDNQGEEFVSEYCRRTPLGRMAQPEDYQGAVVYMASPASSYMTGSVVVVDGGWTAW